MARTPFKKHHFRVDHLNLDSGTGVFLQRELETIDKQNYTDLLPGTKALDYLPQKQDVPDEADSITWKMFTQRGRARKGAKNATNLPRVSLTMTPQTRRIEQLPLSYSWTQREIMQAAKWGVPLEQLTVMAAQMAARQFIDQLLAKGNGGDIEGILRCAQVGILTPTAKTGGAVWTTAGNKPDEVIADFTKIVGDLEDGLKQTDAPGFDKFTILVPTKKHTYLSTTPRSDHSDTTILQFILKNFPQIEAIEPWSQCDASAANNTDDRLVAYPRLPLAGEAVVPNQFRPGNPQELGQDINVPVSASCGGYICRYPVGFRYMDGI